MQKRATVVLRAMSLEETTLMRKKVRELRPFIPMLSPRNLIIAAGPIDVPKHSPRPLRESPIKFRVMRDHDRGVGHEGFDVDRRNRLPLDHLVRDPCESLDRLRNRRRGLLNWSNASMMRKTCPSDVKANFSIASSMISSWAGLSPVVSQSSTMPMRVLPWTSAKVSRRRRRLRTRKSGDVSSWRARVSNRSII